MDREMRKEGQRAKNDNPWRHFWGREQCTREELGCKRVRRIKRLRLPFFAEESVIERTGSLREERS